MTIHTDTTSTVPKRRTSPRRRPLDAPAPARTPRASGSAPTRAPEDADPAVQTRGLYMTAAKAAGEAAAAALQLDAWAIAAKLRRVCEHGGDGLATVALADRWLKRRFGHCDDMLRRALTASLALVLAPKGLPVEIAALYPAAHLRLAKSLSGGAPYDPDFFAKDLAFVCGFFAPVGALTLGVPTARGPLARLVHAKRAAGLMLRMARSGQGGAMLYLLASTGARPWVELHVDSRNLREFGAEGFDRTYHRIAALLRERPDIAGVHGASWLYDPAAAAISPSLGFISEPVRTGGAVLVRLGVDPVQTAYAVSRSPTRRQMWLDGLYNPACYGLYWPRQKLIAWSDARR
jgi:hypothetical protein